MRLQRIGSTGPIAAIDGCELCGAQSRHLQHGPEFGRGRTRHTVGRLLSAHERHPFARHGEAPCSHEAMIQERATMSTA
jgi:hypothetical protein